jgi:glutamate synthase (ferredoxin)
LISPPPHHDIYSIEDLAQLIFDLREVNPHARISVKLVSSQGIGTIAAGVAKAGADIIQISGHDGGTGAAPVTSIKHAGMPWEFGLAETHRTLIANGLRDKVLLRVDGGLRTGWDVVTAAMLGADQYGFGSIALVSQGCIMARVCHTNNCPVGITSQKEELRKKFKGTPDRIVQFFLFLAEEVRHELARLGLKSLEEAVGRTDLLRQREQYMARPAMDLEELLSPLPEAPVFPISTYRYTTQEVSDANELTSSPDLIEAIETTGQAQKSCWITNRDRAVGARIAGAIARKWGDDGFAGLLKLRFSGSAGQSFGAFIVRGMQMELTGDANDYVGKGMSGGQIVVRSTGTFSLPGRDNVLVGNTCLYGATGGALFVAGKAGERFAVRNCNAVAVVEGAGDHCCEYMTGGTVAVLGSVGRNFGAGMTGGVAFVFDEHNEFASKLNQDCDKTLERVSESAAVKLKALVERHLSLTGSQTARNILDNWHNSLPYFWAVISAGYEDVPEEPEIETADVELAPTHENSIEQVPAN